MPQSLWAVRWDRITDTEGSWPCSSLSSHLTHTTLEPIYFSYDFNSQGPHVSWDFFMSMLWMCRWSAFCQITVSDFIGKIWSPHITSSCLSVHGPSAYQMGFFKRCPVFAEVLTPSQVRRDKQGGSHSPGKVTVSRKWCDREAGWELEPRDWDRQDGTGITGYGSFCPVSQVLRSVLCICFLI